MTPRFTVLMTCYNEEAYVETAIRSALAQSAEALIERIIIVDDGSRDGSPALLDRLADEIPRLHVEHIENRGLSGARNHGLERVETPYVAILDGDDIWPEHKVARMADAVAAASLDVGLWYSGFETFYDVPGDGTSAAVNRYAPDHPNLLRTFFIRGGPIIPSTVVLRTEAARAVGWFDATIRLYEDSDMWMRLAENGWRFQFVEDSLLYKRSHRASLSQSRIDQWRGAFEEVGRRAIARRPELAAALPLRKSVRAARLANAYFTRGSDPQGWAALADAIRHNPLNRRAWLYAAKGLAPFRLRSRLWKRLKDARGVL